MAKQVLVQFRSRWGRYNAGEKAHFPRDQVAHLLVRGTAVELGEIDIQPSASIAGDVYNESKAFDRLAEGIENLNKILAKRL